MSIPCLLSSCLALTAQTLTVFLGVVLAKRYTNPSSEIITVLAGLDDVDDVFLEFANAIETLIRADQSGMKESAFGQTLIDSFLVDIRQKAIEVAIALTAGAYQTSLVSYFTHRDLFPCLMKVCIVLVIMSYTLLEGPAVDPKELCAWIHNPLLPRLIANSTYKT